LEILQRIEEDYHCIKDDIPLVSVYTIGDVRVRGMLILDAFLTEEICSIDDFKEYETVFMNGKKRKQSAGESSSPQKSLKITIRQQKVVEREHDDDDSKDRCARKDVQASRVYDPEHGTEVYLIESNLKLYITATIIKDRDAFRLDVPYLVSQEFNAQAPKIIKELFRNYVQSNVIQVHSTITTLTGTTSSADIQQQLYFKMKRSLQDQANHPALWEVLKRKFEKTLTSKTSCRDDDIHSHHDDHQENDAPPEGEKRVKRHKALKRSKSAREETVIDEDEVIPKDETPELIIELQDVDKCVPTIYDYERIEAILNDALSNQFKNAEEYAYHLEQTTNFKENQIVWESRQEEIRQVDLEEKMNRWVRKEFKNFNEEARLTIQHWKDSWHKMVYKQKQRRVRNNPEDYFFKHRIAEVVKITTNQPHGLDFMEQILVMRENDKLGSFSEADFKYLNKNDIEDLYYICQSNKVNYRETKLMNSLITFINSRLIWERVHDFQLGIESYQIKVNLTAPTLTFPGIEACEPHSIVDKPDTGMIYLNSKDEKWVMCLVEIVKFCDATLEKVLKEVKLKIFQSETLKDRDIMRAFEREITKRLNHREQMRIWESFMNRRLILPTMKHL
ncbi:hypothetical protein Tco_0247047, partial [Tanacetum coccineum]